MAAIEGIASVQKSMAALSLLRTQCLRTTRMEKKCPNPRYLSKRSLTTTSQRPAQTEEIRAAPEIDLNDTRDLSETAVQRMRVVPASAAYFTSKPSFTDDYLLLSGLQRQYASLPQLPSAIQPRVAWKKLEAYKELVGGEPVSAARYARLIEMLGELNRIHPKLMPGEVTLALERFKRDIQPFDNKARAIEIDRFGRAIGVGRRKTSTARAWLVEGDGQVLVNGKSLTQFFGRLHDRESAIWALKSLNRVDKYNVFALVEGGGTTGQAEALTLAVGKALLVHEPALKPALRRAGCMTRDPRKVERKKPGHVKARKMPTWVKR